ncbi:MAG: helix-turn-helix domain-containing protein [Roseimicrobium sp.]
MPPTLGQKLKHARETRRLALGDIAHQTKIPVARLQDLEADNLTSFGSLTYAKSFLRTYADFLNVNADEAIGHLHPPPLGGPRDYKYLTDNHGPWVSDRDEHRAMTPSGPPVTNARSFAFAAIACLSFGAVVAGVALANAYFQGKLSSPVLFAAAPPVELVPTLEPAVATVPTPAPTPAQTKAGEQASLSPDAFRDPEAALLKEGEEFTVYGVRFILESKKQDGAGPPQAQAGSDQPAEARKAQPVR